MYYLKKKRWGNGLAIVAAILLLLCLAGISWGCYKAIQGLDLGITTLARSSDAS